MNVEAVRLSTGFLAALSELYGAGLCGTMCGTDIRTYVLPQKNQRAEWPKAEFARKGINLRVAELFFGRSRNFGPGGII